MNLVGDSGGSDEVVVVDDVLLLVVGVVGWGDEVWVVDLFVFIVVFVCFVFVMLGNLCVGGLLSLVVWCNVWFVYDVSLGIGYK